MTICDETLSESRLIEYWAGDLPGEDVDRVEEHVFACERCAGRLAELAALGTGVAAVARQGRISGIVSRGLVNRLQRDGVKIRMFSLLPGETVPCAVYPGDDLIVTLLRADVAGVDEVNVSVTGPGDAPFARYDGVPVSGPVGELFWVTPAAVVKQMPSMHLEITLTSAGASPTELAKYMLDHSAHDGMEDGQPVRSGG